MSSETPIESQRVMALIGYQRASSRVSISPDEITLRVGLGLREIPRNRPITQQSRRVMALETGGVIGPPRIYVRVVGDRRTAFFSPSPKTTTQWIEAIASNGFQIEVVQLPRLMRGPASLVSHLILWPYAVAHGWLENDENMRPIA